jgi:hypothetical protein
MYPSVHHAMGRLRIFWFKIEVVNNRGQDEAFPPLRKFVSSHAIIMGIKKSVAGSLTS